MLKKWGKNYELHIKKQKDEMASANNHGHQVQCCICGYHVYQKIWIPIVGKVLTTT